MSKIFIKAVILIKILKNKQINTLNNNLNKFFS